MICSKTANINVKTYQFKTHCKADVMYHSTEIAKIFWVTLDVAMHGAAYGPPCVAPSRVTQKIFAVLME